jgi:hypothetical protein
LRGKPASTSPITPGSTDENLQSLRKAFGEVRDGSRDVHSFLRYAEYWFERHIIEEDKPFAASVRACRLRSSTASSSPSPTF